MKLPAAELCSAVSRIAGEPLAGSAPQARLWVLLEQPGPWGHDAVLQSHLDESIGHRLKAWVADRPVRLGMMRRPGHHADVGGPRSVLIADTDPSASWLVQHPITDPRELLTLDLDELLTTPPTSARRDTPTLLICTNARRDRCCALFGRPLAGELARSYAGQVWETSHLGGHRFAPTMLSLPDGYLYGGPEAASMTTAACRGRSSLTPDAQAAEIAALSHLGARHPTPLAMTQLGDGLWRAATADGRTTVDVKVERVDGTPPRQESCSKPAVPWQRLVASVVG